MHYLTGVDDPKGLMDLIWHHARKERGLRSVKVDEVWGKSCATIPGRGQVSDDAG